MEEIKETTEKVKKKPTARAKRKAAKEIKPTETVQDVTANLSEENIQEILRHHHDKRSQLYLEDIKKVYGKDENKVEALKGLTFGVNEGEFVVILGASGAGKSTLLNILGGMETATSGTFLINGRDVTSLNEKQLGVYRRKEIGFVFQFYNLMQNLTALENVVLAESLSDNPLDSQAILKLVGLEERENNFPSALSGGEQQRVAIARAIAKNPTLLLCDEPTGALDSKTGAKVLKLLRDVNKKYNKTIIVVTHNSAIAEIADRVIHLQDGRIVDDRFNEVIKDVDDIVW